MPDVRNCRKCGKIFTYAGGNLICQPCRQADEEDFKKIKNYLYDNPRASLTQISADIEISVEKIKRFLKDGRLEILSDEGNLFLECEGCGKSIKSGRFCPGCENGLANNLKAAASQMKSEMQSSVDDSRKGIGMRYLNKEDGKK